MGQGRCGLARNERKPWQVDHVSQHVSHSLFSRFFWSEEPRKNTDWCLFSLVWPIGGKHQNHFSLTGAAVARLRAGVAELPAPAAGGPAWLGVTTWIRCWADQIHAPNRAVGAFRAQLRGAAGAPKAAEVWGSRQKRWSNCRRKPPTSLTNGVSLAGSNSFDRRSSPPGGEAL